MASNPRCFKITLAAIVLAFVVPATASAQCPSYLSQWGSLGSGDGQFDTPFAAAADGAGNLYVADRDNNRIQKFTGTGTYLTQWGTSGSGDGQFNNPTGVAVDPSGDIYVVDSGNSRVQKFTGTGTYLTQWGSSGNADGQFASPTGVATDASGNVYIADTDNDRIQKFNSTGTFLTKWGVFGNLPGQFQSPKGVAADAGGNVYVVDTNNHRIQKFTSAGTPITTWGSSGFGDGQFDLPGGVATDAAGDIYVADTNNQRIQKFTNTGTYVCQWGLFGSGVGQFDNPTGVAAGAAGTLYVMDSNNQRVQRFGPRTVEGSIDLAWNDCGAAGTQCTGFACDVNTGAFPLVASFKVSGVTNFLGFSAGISVQSSTASLPDWWKHGTGICRGTSGLSVDANFTSGPFTCADATIGAATGGFTYTIGVGGPDKASVSVQFAVPEKNSVALEEGLEYYAFKLLLLRSKSTGPGNCVGCNTPMTLTLDQLQIFQLPGLGFDPVLTTPLVSNVANWQGCALPPPVNVTATAQCAAISVGWDPVAGATGYRVKRDGVVISGGSPVAGPPFVDGSPGTAQRCYTVCAVSTTDWQYSAAACASATPQVPGVSAPASRTVRAGTSLTFDVSATNAQTYSWRKNSVAISGANAPSLLLANVDVSAAGSYDVEVCNLCGCTTSAPATLSVCPEASVEAPSLLLVAAGTASVVISGTISGSGTLQWYKNGDPISNGSKYSGTSTGTLTISNIVVADEAYYGLDATDPCGTLESNACYLKVVTCPDAPTITTEPADQAAAFGTPASFTIAATSCDVVHYQWSFHNGSYWDDIPGAIGSTYTIPSVSPSDQGNYRCLVYTVGSPTAYSRTATLNLTKPEILSITSKPVSCTAGEVTWTTNVPTQGYVIFGPGCGALVNSVPAGPFSTTGSAQVALGGSSSAQFKVFVTDVHGQQTVSDCATVYFDDSAANLSVYAFGKSNYEDLFATDDGVPIRVTLINNGCADISDPIVLADLRINGIYQPRKPDNSVDVPRLLTPAGLMGQQSLSVTDLMFSRSELGLPSGASVWVTGRVEYGDAPVHIVYISSRIHLP